MKKLIILIFGGLFFLVVPQVSAEKINEWIEIEREIYNSCTKENVLYSGEAHNVEKIWETKNGKRFNFKSNENTNMVGVGMTSGDPYYIKIVENQYLHITVGSSDQETISALSHARIVNLETGVVAKTKYVGHTVKNANGEITADIRRVDYDCSALED